MELVGDVHVRVASYVHMRRGAEESRRCVHPDAHLRRVVRLHERVHTARAQASDDKGYQQVVLQAAKEINE